MVTENYRFANFDINPVKRCLLNREEYFRLRQRDLFRLPRALPSQWPIRSGCHVLYNHWKRVRYEYKIHTSSLIRFYV